MTRADWIRRSAPVLTHAAMGDFWPMAEDEDDQLFGEWTVVEGLPLYGQAWRYVNDGETLTIEYVTPGGVQQRQWIFDEMDSYLEECLTCPDPRDFDATVEAVWDLLARVDPQALQPAEAAFEAPQGVLLPPAPPVDAVSAGEDVPWWLGEIGEQDLLEAEPMPGRGGLIVLRGGRRTPWLRHSAHRKQTARHVSQRGHS